jgi:DNA-binding GntR family transcriptional regulator
MDANETSEGTSLGEEAYQALRQALISGQYLPGQKITLRALAAGLGMSVTPVREAIHRLSAERALEGTVQRSVRVPTMTRAKILELRDIRLAVEGLAAARAAEHCTAGEIRALRVIAVELMAARQRGDVATDIAKLTEYQFAVYRMSRMPRLVRLIESLWLQTGPCLRLLYPDYIDALRTDWRGKLSRALEARDGEAARRAVESDVGPALTFIADLADASGVIHADRPRKASAVPGRGRKRLSPRNEVAAAAVPSGGTPTRA